MSTGALAGVHRELPPLQRNSRLLERGEHKMIRNDNNACKTNYVSQHGSATYPASRFAPQHDMKE